MIELASTSLEYIRGAVITDADPTTSTIEMAVTAMDVLPASGDWKPAAWFGPVERRPDGAVLSRFRVLVGPTSGIGALGAGEHDVWMRVTSIAEIPVVRVGSLIVYP